MSAEWRYDDAEHVYPHIYGPLEMDAVRAVEQLRRTDDGRFLDVVGPYRDRGTAD